MVSNNVLVSSYSLMERERGREGEREREKAVS
jgi:hypothetical protein